MKEHLKMQNEVQRSTIKTQEVIMDIETVLGEAYKEGMTVGEINEA